MRKERDLFVNMIVADIRKETLFIHRRVLETLNQLSSPNTELYFTYKNRYPNFKEQIVDTFVINGMVIN